MKRALALTLTLVVIFWCNAYGQQSANLLQGTVVDLQPGDSLPLGRGVFLSTQDVRGDCVSYPPVETAIYKGQLVSYDAKLVSSRSEFQDFVDASASMQASSIAGLNASASASFSNHTSIDTYDVTYLAKVSVINQGTEIKDVLIKPEILVKLQTQADPLTWFVQTCGDNFVSKIVSGGNLIAALSLSTKDTADATTLTAQLKGSTLTFSANGSFSQSISKRQEDSSLNISLLRSGGKGISLPGSLDELTKQVQSFPGDVSGDKAAPLQAIMRSYLTIQNLPNVVGIPMQQNIVSVDALVEDYNKTQDEIDRVAFITSHPEQFYLDPFDVPVLARQSTALLSLKDELARRIKECVASGKDCGQVLPPFPEGTVYPGRR